MSDPTARPTLPPELRLHLSIDLETLGTAPGCAIASVGWVLFRESDGEIVEQCEEVVDLATCFAIGLHTDPNTLKWWLTQTSSEAREKTFGADGDMIGHVLATFNDLVANYSAAAGNPWGEIVGVWGWPASFDIAILEAASHAFTAAEPFRATYPLFDHRLVRCGRTLAGITGIRPQRDPAAHHTALADARAQADAIYAGLKLLRDREQRLAELLDIVTAARPYVETCDVPDLLARIDAERRRPAPTHTETPAA